MIDFDALRGAGAAGLAALLVSTALSVGPAGAEPERIDGIAAVVESEIILSSEVEEEIYLANLRGQVDLTDPAALEAFRLEVVEALIEGKILLAKARAEGMQVGEEEIDAAVDRMVDDIRGRFGDESEFEMQLAREGTTVSQLEADFRPKVEEQLLVRQFVDREVRSQVTVDEREVRQYWEEHKDEMPSVPAELELSRILVRFDASPAVDSSATARAGIVRTRLAAGEDFETLATVFSEGPAASRGGDLGWFRLADLEASLAEALRGRDAGYLTDVVLSSRGAHILRIDEVAGGGEEMRVHQIVFLRDEDAARASARARVESLLRRVRAGESFAAVAASESDDATSASSGGRLGSIVVEQLDPKYRDALEDLEPGEVSGILEGREGFAIFRVDGRKGVREATYEDVHDRLMTRLEQDKGAGIYERLVERVRREVFVENRLIAGVVEDEGTDDQVGDEEIPADERPAPEDPDLSD